MAALTKSNPTSESEQSKKLFIAGQLHLFGEIKGIGVIESGLNCCTSKKPGYAVNNDCNDSIFTENGSAMNESRCIINTRKPGQCAEKETTVRLTRECSRKLLLYPMKVNFPTHSVTAIVGPSGCGKSNLIKFLAGRNDSGLNVKGTSKLKTSCEVCIMIYLSCLLFIT